MYNLYVDHNLYILKLTKLKSCFKRDINRGILIVTDKVERYNEYYYFCSNKKNIKKYAEDVKVLWVNYLNNKLKEVQNITIQ